MAIQLEQPVEVSERFAGARLYTATVHEGNAARCQLRLECTRAALRNEFAVVCAQFLEPGGAGKERQSLVADPIGWWTRWRELLGNALRDKRPYSALGELLAWERLLDLGEAPSWEGPRSGSHDLETGTDSFEVKSTISRYESRISIAGHFQLSGTSGRALHLVFQRFEPSPSGDSIDDVVRRLVSKGADGEEIEGGLESLGLERGSSARTARFRLLESLRYKVDESFPRVTPASFVGGALPTGIVSFQYEVDLASLRGTPF